MPYYLVIGWRTLSRTKSVISLLEPKSQDPGADVERALRLHCSTIQIKLQESKDFEKQTKRYLEEQRSIVREETNFEPPSGYGPTIMNIVGMARGGVTPTGREFYDRCFTSIGSSTAAADVQRAIGKGASKILIEVTKWGTTS